MSNLQYYAFPGMGEAGRKQYGLSQAVRIGDRVECSGQVGWDPSTGSLESRTSVTAQIDQAFANVALNLADAGVAGGDGAWNKVYRVNSYHAPLVTDEAMEAMSRNFARYMPGHNPIWTCVGVSNLAGEGFKVEIEVVAYDPEGAKVAEEKKKKKSQDA